MRGHLSETYKIHMGLDEVGTELMLSLTEVSRTWGHKFRATFFSPKILSQIELWRLNHLEYSTHRFLTIKEIEDTGLMQEIDAEVKDLTE